MSNVISIEPRSGSGNGFGRLGARARVRSVWGQGFGPGCRAGGFDPNDRWGLCRSSVESTERQSVGLTRRFKRGLRASVDRYTHRSTDESRVCVPFRDQNAANACAARVVSGVLECWGPQRCRPGGPSSGARGLRRRARSTPRATLQAPDPHAELPPGRRIRRGQHIIRMRGLQVMPGT